VDTPALFLTCSGITVIAGLLMWWRCAGTKRCPAIGLACICIGLGGVAGEAVATWRDHVLRGELLQRSRLLAAGLDRRDLAAHRNLPDDVGQPWFKRIKERLIEARSSDPELRYVYLIEQVGNVLHFPNDDDDPVSMPDYEPPGTPYTDAPSEMRQAVALGNSFSLGPYDDRWGEFISVGAPINVSPGRSMTLTLDVNAARWRSELWFWRAWPLLLGAAFAGIVVLLWSRGQALEATRLAVKAEEEANRAKDAYLATVSHDLRNPLSGIIGMTGLLADTELSANQREYVQLAHDSGQQLLTLVNELLDYARIEAGELDFDRVHCPLREVIEDSVALLAPLATAKGVELNAVISRDLPAALLGDPDRIRQLLHNLIGNAVKFTDEGEVTVRVAVAPEGGTGRLLVTMAVRDTGIGINSATLARLFKPFSQGSEAGRKRGGTGLGLCIAQRIARGLGGDIAVESAPRAGSTFTASIILEPDPHPPEIDLVKPSHRGSRIVVGIEHTALREGLCELIASVGLVPVPAEDPADAGRIATTTPVPAAAIIDAGWMRSAAPSLVAAGVPVATVASRNAGGTQMLASRRTPILLRPIRRDGLLRLFGNLWSDRVSTARITKPETTTVRPMTARTRAPSEPDYAPSLDLKQPQPSKPSDKPPSGPAIELLSSGLRSGLEAMCEAVEKGDLVTVRRIAHGLRSAAEPLHLVELVDTCLALESAAGGNDQQAVRSIAERLEELRRHTQHQLTVMRREVL
jgi:signal transduction histidine kinase/HPt (histidine-containing phosphotransfer) domain-containing protein